MKMKYITYILRNELTIFILCIFKIKFNNILDYAKISNFLIDKHLKKKKISFNNDTEFLNTLIKEIRIL